MVRGVIRLLTPGKSRGKTVLFGTLFAFWLGLHAPASAQRNNLTVLCNGTPVQSSVLVRNGLEYCPVDPIASALHLSVSWNPATKELKINDNLVIAEPLYVAGHLYLPVEAIAEAGDCSCSWDASRVVATLTRRGAPAKVAKAEPDMAYDPSFEGRLPTGWQFKNPLAPNTGPPAVAPVNGSLPTINPAVLDRINTNSGDVFIPKIARNAAFQVTITNLEKLTAFRGYYQPKGGHRFIVVYLSEKNVSSMAQVNPGRFYLMDQMGTSYEAMEDLSSFWPVILRPYGVNFGYLVYEVPEERVPSSLVLTSTGNAPLSMNL